jgi:hypothetical protein
MNQEACLTLKRTISKVDMKKNMGNTDKLLRIIAAIACFAIVVFMKPVAPYNIILRIAGLVLAATSLFSFCPLYALFGMNTCGIDNKQGK